MQFWLDWKFNGEEPSRRPCPSTSEKADSAAHLESFSIWASSLAAA